MRYDFDTPVSRTGTGSVKWDVKEGELPMWVADMDFRAAPEILAALGGRLAHGIFGYTEVPDDWYGAYVGHWKDRHGFELKKEWLMFCTGVIPAISSSVRKLTTPNENVIIQPPVYNIFVNCTVNNGCRVLENPLVYENGRYSMDFDDLERKMSDPQTTLMILCNPHNPAGRIWSAEELATVGELAKKHGVTVISDEIHCDITEPGRDYVPFASVSGVCSEVSVTCMAPTKAFNLAGLQSAAISVPNPFLRSRVNRAINTDEVAEPNAFACPAAIAAFREGCVWLDEMRGYVSENKRVFTEYIEKNLAGVRVVRSEATYLLWADISGISDSSRDFCGFLRAETGLFITPGATYGTGGEGFVRINVACPRAYVIDGAERFVRGAEKYLNKKRV